MPDPSPSLVYDRVVDELGTGYISDSNEILYNVKRSSATLCSVDLTQKLQSAISDQRAVFGTFKLVNLRLLI